MYALQNAAGIFNHLLENDLKELRVPINHPEPASPDFAKSTLTAFINLCLAQGQECFWQQATIGWLFFCLLLIESDASEL